MDWLENPGFGDRARRDGDATHVPPDTEAKLRDRDPRWREVATDDQGGTATVADYRSTPCAEAEAEADARFARAKEAMAEFAAFAEGRREAVSDPEAEAEEPSPLFTAVAAAAVAGFVVTTWFLLLDMCHAGQWTPAEVTAPLWGLVLVGAAATLVVAVGLGAVDAWDAHCHRRAIRRDRRP